MLLNARIRTGCFLCCLLVIGCGSAKPNVVAVKQDLAKALPPQSTPAQVLDYLSSKGIEHSQYLNDPRKGRCINAFVRDKTMFATVKTNCGLLFHFDDHDRLVSFEAREIRTGP
jgi:hypothetical protein